MVFHDPSHQSRYSPWRLAPLASPYVSESVNFTGDNFLKGMRAYFDSMPALVTSEAVDHFTVRVPATLPEGWHRLRVENINSGSSTMQVFVLPHHISAQRTPQNVSGR